MYLHVSIVGNCRLVFCIRNISIDIYTVHTDTSLCFPSIVYAIYNISICFTIPHGSMFRCSIAINPGTVKITQSVIIYSRGRTLRGIVMNGCHPVISINRKYTAIYGFICLGCYGNTASAGTVLSTVIINLIAADIGSSIYSSICIATVLRGTGSINTASAGCLISLNGTIYNSHYSGVFQASSHAVFYIVKIICTWCKVL